MMATRMARHRLRTEVQGGGLTGRPGWPATHGRPPAFNRRTSWGREHRPDLLRRGRAWLSGTYHVSPSGSCFAWSHQPQLPRRATNTQGSKVQCSDTKQHLIIANCNYKLQPALFNSDSLCSPTVRWLFNATFAISSRMACLVLINLTLICSQRGDTGRGATRSR